jgi:hypothetical protein
MWEHRALAARRLKNETRNAEVTAAILTACGIRTRYADKWRALSPNAVLHFEFGPGLAVATNGVDVVLWSAPSFGCDWMLVHRMNVRGPVTGTPHRVADWDYLNNCPSKRPQGAKVSRAEREQKALDLL